MKLDGGGQKSGGDLLVQLEGSFDDVESVSLDHRVEIPDLQVRSEDAVVNRLQSVKVRERNREHREMALQSGGEEEEEEENKLWTIYAVTFSEVLLALLGPNHPPLHREKG